jgi:hypothetical protein
MGSDIGMDTGSVSGYGCERGCLGSFRGCQGHANTVLKNHKKGFLSPVSGEMMTAGDNW